MMMYHHNIPSLVTKDMSGSEETGQTIKDWLQKIRVVQKKMSGQTIKIVNVYLDHNHTHSKPIFLQDIFN